MECDSLESTANEYADVDIVDGSLCHQHFVGPSVFWHEKAAFGFHHEWTLAVDFDSSHCPIRILCPANSTTSAGRSFIAIFGMVDLCNLFEC